MEGDLAVVATTCPSPLGHKGNNRQAKTGRGAEVLAGASCHMLVGRARKLAGQEGNASVHRRIADSRGRTILAKLRWPGRNGRGLLRHGKAEAA